MAVVGILSPGDMGHTVGGLLRDQGVDVVTCLAGRSEHTRELAAQAGFRDLPSVKDVVAASSLVLSIVPPASADEVAAGVAEAMRTTGARPAFAEMNAIAPEHSLRLAELFASLDATYVDGSIISGPPPKVRTVTLYVCGPDSSAVLALPGLEINDLGPELGRASALKMLFSGVNKGFNALAATMLTAAERFGLGDELLAELARRREPLHKVIQKVVPFLPVNSGRWVAEMEEIADTLEHEGLPGGFHEGAAFIFGLLARTPFSAETRATFDATRTARQTAAAAAQLLSEDTDQD